MKIKKKKKYRKTGDFVKFLNGGYNKIAYLIKSVKIKSVFYKVIEIHYIIEF